MRSSVFVSWVTFVSGEQQSETTYTQTPKITLKQLSKSLNPATDTNDFRLGNDFPLSFVDSTGRETFFRGTNAVVKGPPWYPYDEEFDEKTSLVARDFQIMRAMGLNMLRLGTMWAGGEPEKGKFNDNYFAKIKQLVKLAKQYGVYVLADMHQDCFSERYCGEGMPSWLGPVGDNSTAVVMDYSTDSADDATVGENLTSSAVEENIITTDDMDMNVHTTRVGNANMDSTKTIKAGRRLNISNILIATLPSFIATPFISTVKNTISSYISSIAEDIGFIWQIWEDVHFPISISFPEPILKPFTTTSKTDKMFPTRQDCSALVDKVGFQGGYATIANGRAFQDLYDNYDSYADHWGMFMRKTGETLIELDNFLGLELINEPFAGNPFANPLRMIPQFADRFNLQPVYDIVADKIRQSNLLKDTLIFFAAVPWADLGGKIDSPSKVIPSKVIIDSTGRNVDSSTFSTNNHEYFLPNGFTHVPGGVTNTLNDYYKDKSVYVIHYYTPPQATNESLPYYRDFAMGNAKRLGSGLILSEMDRDANEADYEYFSNFGASFAWWEFKDFCRETIETIHSDSQQAKFGACKTGFGGVFAPNSQKLDHFSMNNLVKLSVVKVAGAIQGLIKFNIRDLGSVYDAKNADHRENLELILPTQATDQLQERTLEFQMTIALEAGSQDTEIYVGAPIDMAVFNEMNLKTGQVKDDFRPAFNATRDITITTDPPNAFSYTTAEIDTKDYILRLKPNKHFLKQGQLVSVKVQRKALVLGSPWGGSPWGGYSYSDQFIQQSKPKGRRLSRYESRQKAYNMIAESIGEEKMTIVRQKKEEILGHGISIMEDANFEQEQIYA